MRCPRCDYNIRERALFCPNCGAKLEQPPPLAPAQATRPLTWGNAAETPPAAKSGNGLTWLVIGVAMLVLLLIGALGYAAVQAGRHQRALQIEQAADDLYERGEAYLLEGQLELAAAAYEQALLYMPDHEAANKRLAQVREQLDVQPTSTPLLQRETKQAFWNELMAAYEIGNWELVIQQADKLIGVDPDYNRDQVDDMLITAFYELGLRLVEQDQMIEAVRYFDSALVLAPNNGRIALAKDLATRYMTGMGYWAADWPQTIAHLRGAYDLDSQYKDVAERLNDALVQYGDLLIVRQMWCQASEQYTQALAIRSEAAIVAKNQEATLKCAETPTPVPGGGAPPIVSAPSGTFVGRLAGVEDIPSGKMFIRGRVLDENGQGVPDTRVGIQAWDWTASATTDSSGQFSFDGLGNAVVYTLTLTDLPSGPVNVEGQWGKLSWVEFVRAE